MFNSNISDDEDNNCQLLTKKKKLNTECSSGLVHSSLNYSSFKAPPLVEYNCIDSYCERKLGKSFLPSYSLDDANSDASLSKVESISSPIVLKSPKLPTAKISLIDINFEPPYSFYSVEELSLVNNLDHWTNTKVCPVGQVEFDSKRQQCFLHSVLEKGHWQLVLETSLLREIPKLKTVLQIFGTMKIIQQNHVLQVHFYRNLGSTDLNLFIRSYSLMQKHIPDLLNVPQRTDLNALPSFHATESDDGGKLNDTLDDYNLSIVDKCSTYQREDGRSS